MSGIALYPRRREHACKEERRQQEGNLPAQRRGQPATGRDRRAPDRVARAAQPDDRPGAGDTDAGQEGRVPLTGPKKFPELAGYGVDNGHTTGYTISVVKTPRRAPAARPRRPGA